MRLAIVIAQVVVGSIAPVAVSGQTPTTLDDGIPRVVASATKTARIAPDRVNFYAVVEGGAESAPEAAQRAERKLAAINDAVKQLGGRAEVLSTMPYGVMPAPNLNGYPGQSTTNPFVARYVMRIQSSRVDQLMGASSALIAAGASSISPPQFEASASDSVRRAKFIEAIAQARADAEALASGMGMRLGALIEVSATGPVQLQGINNQFVSFGRGFDMGPSQPPEVIINASVTVRYRLQPR